MRFPLSLTRSMAGYLLGKRLAGQKQFPMVLMLEPLHACNLKCVGCGRIREYADTVSERLSVEECLAAVDECGAPIVSICGGEPLIYPGLEQLINGVLQRRKHIYLCTNGVLLAEKVAGFQRTNRLFINVHLDGMDATHDAIVGRQGTFDEAVAGIRAAKRAGFPVYTNTTVYKQTTVDELDVLLEFLTAVGVDGFMISPAYGYQAVVDDRTDQADPLFMTRDEIHTKFQDVRRRLTHFKLVTSPLYLDFLSGDRQLPCAAWANPTRNVRGWKGPCYMMTDTHHATYQQLVETTAWDELGPNGDSRCEHCLVHCGFEPAAVLRGEKTVRDMVKMAIWQMT